MKKILMFLAGGFLFPGLVMAAGVQSVLVISIDALHPAAIGSKTTPQIHRLMKAGAYTLKGHSVDPPPDTAEPRGDGFGHGARSRGQTRQ